MKGLSTSSAGYWYRTGPELVQCEKPTIETLTLKRKWIWPGIVENNTKCRGEGEQIWVVIWASSQLAMYVAA